MNSIALVEVVWSDNQISCDYIGRLNKFLNPYDKDRIVTAMWNKEILPGVNKINTYNRFMVVFDYDEQKSYQKCFSYSSPKHDDSKIDLRYFILPTKTKIMLNVPIDIPTAYLIKVNFHKMIEKENNSQIKKNLMDNITNLNHVNHYRNEILEQYEVIYKNIWSNPKFHKNNVQWAHDRMISDQKQHMFCEKEIQLIKQRELLLNKSKQNEPGGGSSGAPNDENRTSVQVYKEWEEKQKAALENSKIEFIRNINQNHTKKSKKERELEI